MTWETIKQTVEDSGGICTFTMDQLRDAHGAGKLGVHVVQKISDTLAGQGLGHIPPELPNHQHEPVRVYKQGTPVAHLIGLVLTPGAQNDRALIDRAEVQSDYATIVVEKIRDLVAE